MRLEILICLVRITSESDDDVIVVDVHNADELEEKGRSKKKNLRKKLKSKVWLAGVELVSFACSFLTARTGQRRSQSIENDEQEEA